MKIKTMLKAALALFLAISVFLYFITASDEITGSKAFGTVNVKDSRLAFEIPGRIVKINVAEGQRVKKGTILASLDTEDLKHQRAIEKSKCEVQKQIYLSLKNGNRKEDIDKARFTLHSLESELELSDKTLQRFSTLLSKKAVSEQEYDSVLYENKILKDKVGQAQAVLDEMVSGARPETILEKKASFEACLSSLYYLDYKINEQSVLKAPFDGTIRSRYSELYDMAGPNVTSFAFCNTDNKEISVYLSNRFLDDNKIKEGLEVKVYTDDRQMAYLTGRVVFISDTAMFTPKNVATVDLRPDLVYECKIALDDKEGRLRFGSDVSVDFAR